MEKANINLPRTCRCSWLVASRYPLFLRYTTNKAIRLMPDTNELANAYQLYLVLYQFASMLIIHNQGTVEPTVKANQTIKRDAVTVFLQIKLLPTSWFCSAAASASLLSLRIRTPSRLHRPIASSVQIRKKVGFKKPNFFNTSWLPAFSSASLLSHW